MSPFDRIQTPHGNLTINDALQITLCTLTTLSNRIGQSTDPSYVHAPNLAAAHYFLCNMLTGKMPIPPPTQIPEDEPIPPRTQPNDNPIA